MLNINRTNEYSAQTHATAPKTAAEETQKKNTTLAADNAENKDKFQDKTSTWSPAYTKSASKTGSNGVGNAQFQNKSARAMKNDAVKGLVANTIGRQAGASSTAFGGYSPINTGNSDIMSALNAAEATSSKYDDYWGVDATAERIFTFARSLAGEDDEMFDKMKDSFLKGFNQALGSRRGNLPSVSYQTKDKVLGMFDDWEKEIADKKSAAAPETEEPAK